MADITTTLTLGDRDQKIISDLKEIIGEKTKAGVIRYAVRELHKNFFGSLISKEIKKRQQK